MLAKLNQILILSFTTVFILFSTTIFAGQLKIQLNEGDIKYRESELSTTFHFTDQHGIPHKHRIQLGVTADYVVEEVDEHGDTDLLIVPESLTFRVYDGSTLISEFDSEEMHPISFQNIIAPSLKVKLAANGKVRELYGMNAFFEGFKEEMENELEFDDEALEFLEELHILISAALKQSLVIFPQEDVTHKMPTFSQPAIWHSSLRMSPIGELQTHDFPNSQELYTWKIKETSQNKHKILISGNVSGSGDLGEVSLKLVGNILGKAEVETDTCWTSSGHMLWEYRYVDQTNGIEIPPEVLSADVEIIIK